MKKYFQSVIPLIMFLALLTLTLAACAPTTALVPSTSSPPTSALPSQSSEEAGLSRPNTPLESDESYASEPFSGIWQYEYGDRNFAQIQIRNETAEGFDFHLFIVEYNQEEGIRLGGFSTNARIGPDGQASYSAGQQESMNSLVHVNGSLVITNGYLNISYENLQTVTDNYKTQLPTTFKRLPSDQTEQAMNKLPFFTREIVGFPFDLTIEESDRLFGQLIEVKTAPMHQGDPPVIMDRYYSDTKVSFYFPEGEGKAAFFFSIETAHPDLGFIRDIQVGDSLESVIAKFPDEKNPIKVWYQDKTQTLYGQAAHLQTYGRIQFEENGLKNIWYSDGGRIFKLEFDTTNHVSKMTLSNASN